jgi:hypothetical protein
LWQNQHPAHTEDTQLAIFLELAPTFPGFPAAIAHFHEVLIDVAKHIELGTELHGVTPEVLLQGPFSDAMTHAGQLALLRRLSGSPSHPKTSSSPTSRQKISAPINPNPAAPTRIGPRSRNRENVSCGL